jgi:hypothetical protein
MRASSSANYAGTAIFLGYIGAALVLVFRQIGNILSAYNALKTSQEKRQKAGIFAGLAVLSFAVLSFNMLSDLFVSYRAYSKDSGFRVSLSDTRLWSWMLHSNLFEEFADALAESHVTWWWTQLALLVTMHICIWLAQNCMSLHICELARTLQADLWSPDNLNGRNGLPELGLISQILPISFTLNLSYIHAVLDARPRDKAIPPAHHFSAIPLLSIVGIYLAGLSYVPTQSAKGSLIPLVLLLRLLLALPSFLTPAVSTKSVHALLAILGIAMQAQTTLNAFSAGYGWRDIAKAIHAHPAVTTLGYDAVIAIVSSLIYRCSI